MRYSIDPRDRRYVKDYGILFFGESIGKNISNTYSQKLVDSAIKSGATKVATDAIKTASKRAIQKTAEVTSDLVGNKIGDKITSVSKKSKKLPSTDLHLNEANNEIPKKKKIYISKRKTTNY